MTLAPAIKPEHDCFRRVLISMAAIAMLFSVVTANAKVSLSQSTALWRVVHDLCVVDKRTIGLPAPCTAVDLTAGVAIVKDAGGPTGYLVVPTRRLTGIEDPALLKSGISDYWQAAWEARRFVERKAGRQLDRAAVGIAINAVAGRTQNQLHFHVDCVRADVEEALGFAQRNLGNDWISIGLRGHPYWVRSLDGAELGSRDPFKMLADGDPLAASAMGKQTLIVVGAHYRDGPGFFIIRGTASLTNRGHGEELLDHQCKVLG